MSAEHVMFSMLAMKQKKTNRDEEVVKRIKAAIAHSDGTQPGITLACHNLNWEQ